MDNDKYYTPDISEFHVGLEYELFEDFDTLPEAKWHEQIYGPNGKNPESLDYVSDFTISNNRVRVKYLSKEDIESFGFEEIGQENYYLNGDLNSLNIERVFNEKITSYYRINTKDCEQIMFIEIKNKSELKKILKMIGA